MNRADEYLTLDELAGRLKLKKKTLKNKMAGGIFRKGEHYFSPPGIGPRFKWSAIVAWLEQAEPTRSEPREMVRQFPRARKARGLDIGDEPEVNRTVCPVTSFAS